MENPIDNSKQSAATANPNAVPNEVKPQSQQSAPEAKPADSTTQPSTSEAHKSDATDGAKPDAAQGEKAPEAPKVPEKYEFQAPEGVILDPAAVDGFSSYAKEAGMNQQQAQKGMDLAINHFKKLNEQQEKGRLEVIEGWKEKVKSDPVVGGANYEKNLEAAKLGVRWANDPELSEALDSGWGNHPAFVRLFKKIADSFGDDVVHVGGSASPSSGKSAADVFYGKM